MTTATCAFCGSRFRVVLGEAVRFCGPDCSRSAYYRRLLYGKAPVEVEGAPVLAFTSNAEAAGFVASAVEFMAVKAEVIADLGPYLALDDHQMAVAESAGAVVWRYWSPEEQELRERWVALREFSDDWGDYV